MIFQVIALTKNFVIKKIRIAAIASAKTDNANRLADPENLYIPGFEKNLRKKTKKFNHQVASILIIG